MKYFARILSLFPIVIVLSLFLATPALAIPPFPSSFYGTVKVNSKNVPDGTLVQALIGGQVYAKGFTQTYQGNSVFALDVPGDDTDTTALDGGRDGDIVQFKVGGAAADQTAVWRVGTNVALNLTVSSSKPIEAPRVPPSPIPTQTAIVLVQQPSAIPPAAGEDSPASTLPAQPSPVPTEISRSLDDPITDIQLTSTHVPPQAAAENGSGNISTVVVLVIALPVVTAMGYTFLTLRKKKM
jgi:hypothetical protein